MTLLMRMRRRLGRGGNVLILVALAAVPLIGSVALAVDFARTTVVQQRLDLAADSAALLAATAAANAWKAGDADAVMTAKAAAQGRFRAQSGPAFDAIVAPVEIDVTRSGGLFNAVVTYSAQVPTSFARILGFAVVPFSRQSSASLSLNPYVDIQILMDVSSSMTVAATDADIAKMSALATSFKPVGPHPDNIGAGCAFACHWSNQYVDYYQLAVQNKIQLRITVLQNAVTNLINTLEGLNSAKRFQLGLYTFSQGFNVVNPLSYDIAGELGSVGTIVPDINDCSSNCPDTYFSKAMRQLATLDSTLPQQGDQLPQRFLFIVTDGVYDQYTGSNRQIGPFNPADCDAMKALGFNILVLYTPYLPLPTNSYYVEHVQPISPKIVPDLEACASSPSYFFTASDATQITNQLQTMLQLVVRSTSHLTN